MNEFEAIVILAAVFIIAYIVGAFRNRQLLVKYSKIVKKQLQPKSEYVGFRPLGSSGLRVLSNMNKEAPLSRMEIAISLVDRENIMHYPLTLITKEHDRLTVWGFLRVKPAFSLEVYSRIGRPFQKRSQELKLKDTTMGQGEIKKFFHVTSSNEIKARDMLCDDEFAGSLLHAKDFLRYLLVNEAESHIFLTGKLTEQSLGPLLDIVMASGRRTG